MKKVFGKICFSRIDPCNSAFIFGAIRSYISISLSYRFMDFMGSQKVAIGQFVFHNHFTVFLRGNLFQNRIVISMPYFGFQSCTHIFWSTSSWFGKRNIDSIQITHAVVAFFRCWFDMKLAYLYFSFVVWVLETFLQEHFVKPFWHIKCKFRLSSGHLSRFNFLLWGTEFRFTLNFSIRRLYFYMKRAVNENEWNLILYSSSCWWHLTNQPRQVISKFRW